MGGGVFVCPCEREEGEKKEREGGVDKGEEQGRFKRNEQPVQQCGTVRDRNVNS